MAKLQLRKGEDESGPSLKRGRTHKNLTMTLPNPSYEETTRITASTQCTRPASRLPMTPTSTLSAENHLQ